MHILIKSHIFIYLITITTLLFMSAYTLEDNKPLDYTNFELTIEKPNLKTNFVLESFEVEVKTLHLLTASESAAEPKEKDDHKHDHNHKHNHGNKEPSSHDTKDLKITHLKINTLITNSNAISLSEVAITNKLPATSIE